MIGEYGRVVRFQWQPSEVIAIGNEAEISIGEFTNKQKKYYLTLGHLRNVLAAIEGKEIKQPFKEIPDSLMERCTKVINKKYPEPEKEVFINGLTRLIKKKEPEKQKKAKR